MTTTTTTTNTTLFVVVRVRRRGWCRGARNGNCYGGYALIATGMILLLYRYVSPLSLPLGKQLLKSEQTDDNQRSIVKDRRSSPARSLRYLRSSSRARQPFFDWGDKEMGHRLAIAICHHRARRTGTAEEQPVL
jgi:hypothetical protein